MRRILLLAALLGGAAPLSPVRADWEVRRQGNAALLSHALSTLQASPDQPALATRIARLAGKAGLPAALETLRRAAERPPPRYEPIAAHAQLLLAAGRGAEAADAFARALALRPGSVAAAAGRARALALAGRADEAFAAFDEALGRERNPAGREGLLRALVAFAAKAGDAERELAARRELLAARPHDGRGALELAEALRRAGRPAEAAAALETLAAAPVRGQRDELLREAAALREAAGDDEAAERLLRDSLETAAGEPERAETYRRLTEIARRRDTLPALEATLERAVGPGGRGRLAEWEALARVREELGDLAGALEAARRAAALDTSSLALRRQIMVLLDRLGRESELAAAYDEIARRWPDDPTLALERIERLFRGGERDEGRALFDRALRSFRRDGDALAKLADLASRWSEDDRVLAAWDAVLALSPRDERAIVGLGEAHFQRGRRELARRTWRALLTAVRPRADAHARLAELLGDHDLLDEAIGEAKTAQRLDPQNPHHHRTLARILERKKDYTGAAAEWRAVLALSIGPGRAAERREARSSLIGILARDGRSRLDVESVRLGEQLAKNPDDREGMLYLAEIDLRRLDPDRALATLRRAAARWPDDPEIVSALVRLLRQSRQLGEAVAQLEALAAKVPARARDAYVQIAEIELARYADARALEFAARAAAAAGDDPDGLARIGEIEERAGRPERAIETYRRALARGSSPKAAAALQRLLVRQGAAAEASQVLRGFVRATTDEEARAELLRKEIDVSEYLGTLEGLERLMVSLPSRSAAARKVAAALLQRVVPGLYRAAPQDGGAAATLERMSRWGLRPLVELLTDTDAEPDPAVLEVVGMLGNRDATPVLLRLAQAGGGRPRAASSNRSSLAQVAAAIALGRLQDARAVPLLRTLAASPDSGVRTVAVWALGRTRSPAAADLLETATADARTEVAAVACLGLGRLRGPRATRALVQLATDLGRHPRVRRAAALGLGLAGDPEGGRALLPLLDAPDPALARGAAAALGALGDRRLLPALWERALLGRRPGADAARVALRAFAGSGGLPDEALALREARFDVDLLLDGLDGGAGGTADPPALAALWAEHAAAIGALLSRALQAPGEARRRALQALDERDEAALRELGAELRPGVMLALDDPDAPVRRLALRVASRLRDDRLGLAHVQAALAGIARSDLPDAEAAAEVAARALLETGRATPVALAEALRPLLGDPSWERRLVAVRLLSLAGAAAAPDLERALGDPSPFVRAEAAGALAGSPRSAAALARAARDPSAAVRAAAARALARRPAP